MTIRRKTSAAAVLALAAAALPAAAKDYLLVPARPDKLVIVDAGAMAIDKVIQLDGAGPLPQLPVVSKDGSRAYVMMNMLESIAIVDLVNGKTLGRIEMSGAEERVKGMFGMDLSPDGKTLVVYQSPVKMLADEFQVQPTRLAFYDAETGELRSTAEVPRQITLVAWSEDGSRIYGMGRKMYVFDATGKQIEEKPIHGWQTETYAQPDVLDVWSQFEQSGVITTPFYTVRLDLPADDPTIYRTGILTQDLETGEMKMQEVEPTDIFYFSTAASPTDKNRIFGAYNFLSSFDMAEGKPLKRVPLPHSYYSVNVSSDGKTVYLGGAMSDVSAYDAETLEKKGEVQMPDGAAISLASIRMFQRQD
ncbi:MAG: quinohemoprotein amine dehydrogenase subunit beta [Rhodobacteraceae bacterium]|jgi:quinohemoprotein amine dehydrogenase beta subunit|uniref:quinohemoprotein amine dehydrogenase subunit beta n=1 Tax=Albidovulum sp. TaxID=1872424 RepID=UPI001E02CDA0|nr:quinohemoprotein amine dehydrogenase subunit beta [uncultured Defluviimonas sp.]MCB2126715.1 quinohemoprotein amine dehydrogenase subunit beta [Paracoccaceae bacterium]MCC0071226.1 quinohemoprotein amine dehydrogenase subunit beta [Paracoccaceae bacterium]